MFGDQHYIALLPICQAESQEKIMHLADIQKIALSHFVFSNNGVPLLLNRGGERLRVVHLKDSS